MVFSREAELAIAAVTEAASLCRIIQEEITAADTLEKNDRSPVTIADYGSQAVICRHLISSFPQDSIVGEEDANDLRKSKNAMTLSRVIEYVKRFRSGVTAENVCQWIDSGKGIVTRRFWTLDPIDGTKGFLRKGQYAIALALIENGEVQMGALACPSLPQQIAEPADKTGVVFLGESGQGAFVAPLGGDNWTPVRVAKGSDKEKLRFVESVEPAHADHALHRAIGQAIDIAQPALQMDSQAKYCAVARGDAALYLRLPSNSSDYHENIWDHAAGVVIVQEAGGRVTDMRGHPLDFSSGAKMLSNRGVVASNGAIHEVVLKAISRSR